MRASMRCRNRCKHAKIQPGTENRPKHTYNCQNAARDCHRAVPLDAPLLLHQTSHPESFKNVCFEVFAYFGHGFALEGPRDYHQELRLVAALLLHQVSSLDSFKNLCFERFFAYNKER